MSTMTPEETEELAALRQEMQLASLGDRPSSPAASKLRRLIELEEKETALRQAERDLLGASLTAGSSSPSYAIGQVHERIRSEGA